MEVSQKDVYRLYLQAILSRGILSEKVAHLLMEKCYKAVQDSNDQLQFTGTPSWGDFVRNVNASIDRLDMEFRLIQDENTGKVFYALVNRKGDEIAQVATDYSPIEIAFFKSVVEQIMLAPNRAYSVPSLVALRERTALKLNLTSAQGENLLSSFVAKGWLLRSKRGRYSLAMRSLLELLPYLRSTYPDEISECANCDKILTRGIACGHSDCRACIHLHCFTKYRAAKRNNMVCPVCSGPWPNDPKEALFKPIGEEAARGDEMTRRRTRRQTEETEEEDEAEESAEDEEEIEKRPRKSARNEDADMEDGTSQAPRRSTRQR